MKVFTILISYFLLANCENYCSICKNHIACNNDGNIDKKCRATSSVVIIEKQKNYKNIIVATHNKLRNEIASGKLRKFQPAARMATMLWDAELARLAELNLKTCNFEHDKCRNTKRFHYSGQNLARGKINKTFTPEQALVATVENWFMEHNNVDMTVINKYEKIYKPFGHFTVMVADRNTRLGCAFMLVIEDPWFIYVIACNYATTNRVGEPIYKSGKPGSKCQRGTNREYPALCSPDENIDPNKY